MFLSKSRTNVYFIILAIVVFVFIFGKFSRFSHSYVYDPYYPNMHELIFNVTGVSMLDYESQLSGIYNQTSNKFAKADISLVRARLLNNNNFYKEACDLYLQYEAVNDEEWEYSEENAIIFETLASLNCYGQKNRWLKKAILSWESPGLNLTWRAKILEGILHDTLWTDGVDFDTTLPQSRLNLSNATKIMIGNTTLEINNGEKIISQEDRVYRDWLSLQLSGDPFNSTLLNVFSERFTYNQEELRPDIGWHEGGEILDMLSKVNISHSTAIGTMAIKNPQDGKWYAPDFNGVFSFEVLPDKIYYPTTRFLSGDVAMIIDTHGISAIAEQAVRKKADVVIGCCDSVGKIKAGLYLSKHNISVICLTDRFSYLALGDDSKIIGSARLSISKSDGIVSGVELLGSKIPVVRNQKIVVSNIYLGKEYPMFYYATPYYYFSQINKTFPLNIIDVKLSSYNETDKVFDAAITNNVTLVGFRVFNSYDYNVAKKWLNSSLDNRLVLFHSMSYPYGKILANEYPNQISYGDLNPIIIH